VLSCEEAIALLQEHREVINSFAWYFGISWCALGRYAVFAKFYSPYRQFMNCLDSLNLVA